MLSGIGLVLPVAALLAVIPQAGAQTVKELFRKVRTSVVVIKTEEVEVSPETDFRPVSLESIGSGVLIDSRRVLTAAHVVEVATNVVVQFYDGTEVRASVLSSSMPEDIALLELERAQPQMAAATMGDSALIEVGDPLLIVGAPFGLGFSIAPGILSGRYLPPRVTSDLYPVEYLQTDAKVNQGNSGGPLFDMQGRVMGIVSSILTTTGGYEGVAFAVPVATAKRLLWDKHRHWLGADGLRLSPKLAGLLHVVQKDAILVQQVVPNSPAARAGVRPSTISATVGEDAIKLGGDVILSIGGIRTDQRDFLRRARQELSIAGKEVEMVVLREGKAVKLLLKP